MFEDDNDGTSGTFDQLFEDNSNDSEEKQTEDDDSEAKENSEDESEFESESGESDGLTEPEKSNTLATISIDGQDFELDEDKIQRIAENYVQVAQENKKLVKDRDQVAQAWNHIEAIQNGKDIDENMKALGVDFEALIRNRVKEFIRRSTLSEREREFEDMRVDRDNLRTKNEEREKIDATQREQAAGERQAETIIDSVGLALVKVPEKFKKEIQIEVFGLIEKKLRAGGVSPSAKGIQNAVNKIYERKYKTATKDSKESVTKKIVSAPKPTKNNPTPSTQKQKSTYNAEDYSSLFK